MSSSELFARGERSSSSQSKWRGKVQFLAYRGAVKHFRVILHYQLGVGFANPMHEDSVHWNIYKGSRSKSDPPWEDLEERETHLSVTVFSYHFSQSSLLSPSFSGDTHAFVGTGNLMACGRNVVAERPWVLRLLISRHPWGSQPLSSPVGWTCPLVGRTTVVATTRDSVSLFLFTFNSSALSALGWILRSTKKSWLAPI